MFLLFELTSVSETPRRIVTVIDVSSVPHRHLVADLCQSRSEMGQGACTCSIQCWLSQSLKSDGMTVNIALVIIHHPKQLKTMSPSASPQPVQEQCGSETRDHRDKDCCRVPVTVSDNSKGAACRPGKFHGWKGRGSLLCPC